MGLIEHDGMISHEVCWRNLPHKQTALTLYDKAIVSWVSPKSQIMNDYDDNVNEYQISQEEESSQKDFWWIFLFTYHTFDFVICICLLGT